MKPARHAEKEPPDDKPEKTAKSAPAARPLRQWESSVEKAVREAMERGEFDNLRGKGRPLNLQENPHTPPDWRLAFKMLQDAGFAPDWIEADKDIRLELASLRELLARHTHYEKSERVRLQRLAARGGAAARRAEADHVALREARLSVESEFRRRAAELNRSIDTFNLKAPSASVHHLRLRIEHEIAQFEAGLEG